MCGGPGAGGVPTARPQGGAGAGQPPHLAHRRPGGPGAALHYCGSVHGTVLHCTALHCTGGAVGFAAHQLPVLHGEKWIFNKWFLA